MPTQQQTTLDSSLLELILSTLLAVLNMRLLFIELGLEETTILGITTIRAIQEETSGIVLELGIKMLHTT